MKRPRINVYATDKGGWLFADLLRWFSKRGAAVSGEPLKDADIWIAMRTDEWVLSPNPERTILQFHDFWEHSLPATCASAQFVHGGIEHKHRGSSVYLHQPMSRPIGAPGVFHSTKRKPDPERFVVGWVGRPINWQGEEVRSPAKLISALALIKDANGGKPVHLKLAGQNLEGYAREAYDRKVSCELLPRADFGYERYPELYATLDALVITSRSEAGPLPLFEALALGVPVVSTPVGWSKSLIRWGEDGFLWNDDSELMRALQSVRGDLDRWRSPEQTRQIKKWVSSLRLEEWIDECLNHATATFNALEKLG